MHVWLVGFCSLFLVFIENVWVGFLLLVCFKCVLFFYLIALKIIHHIMFDFDLLLLGLLPRFE